MKKKLFAAFAITALAIIMAINLNINSKNNISSLTLANVEALAQETGNGNVYGNCDEMSVVIRCYKACSKCNTK